MRRGALEDPRSQSDTQCSWTTRCWAKKTLGDAKKNVGKDKKRHWVPMTLGDKEVGIDNQDAGQLRQRATKTFGNDKTCLSNNTLGSRSVWLPLRHHHDKLKSHIEIYFCMFLDCSQINNYLPSIFNFSKPKSQISTMLFLGATVLECISSKFTNSKVSSPA